MSSTVTIIGIFSDFWRIFEEEKILLNSIIAVFAELFRTKWLLSAKINAIFSYFLLFWNKARNAGCSSKNAGMREISQNAGFPTRLRDGRHLCTHSLVTGETQTVTVSVSHWGAGLNDGLLSETMDFRDFPSVVSAARIARRVDTWHIVYLSYKDPCPKISVHKSEIKVP